jgi:hypothetical protein
MRLGRHVARAENGLLRKPARAAAIRGCLKNAVRVNVHVAFIAGHFTIRANARTVRSAIHGIARIRREMNVATVIAQNPAVGAAPTPMVNTFGSSTFSVDCAGFSSPGSNAAITQVAARRDRISVKSGKSVVHFIFMKHEEVKTSMADGPRISRMTRMDAGMTKSQA